MERGQGIVVVQEMEEEEEEEVEVAVGKGDAVMAERRGSGGPTLATTP